MLDAALEFLTAELSAYLTTLYKPLEAPAVLTPLLKPDGTAATEARNKVSVTLLNVEPEHLVRNPPPERTRRVELRQRPPLNLNLLVLFAANFDTYSEALKFLQGTLAFFQQQGTFSPPTPPPPGAGIERLVAELETTTYQQWSYVWGMLGTRHVPAVIYRIRLLTIQESTAEQVRLIRQTTVRAEPTGPDATREAVP